LDCSIGDDILAGDRSSVHHKLYRNLASVADARPLDEYAAVLGSAGLRVTHRERHDAAIGRMLDQIQARLTLLRISTTAAHLDPDVINHYLDLARQAVSDGIIGYGLLVAEKP